MTVTIVLCFLSVILYALYRLSIRKFDYWKVQNVPHLKPIPVLGNFGEYILLETYAGQVAQKICSKFPDAPYVGAYYGTEPTLIVQSPELIKLITTKDFYYFSGREISKYTHNEVITQNLFFTYGDRWKVLRQNFTPLFSSAKMKNMFYLIEDASHVFEKLLDEEAKAQSVEIKSLMTRFTMDCIGSCFFGVDTNAMGNNKNNVFRKMGDLIFELSNIRGIFFYLRAIWPAIFYRIGLKVVPTDLDKFFNKLLKDIFVARNYEASGRNDFVDLILGLKKSNYITGDGITNLKTGSGQKISLKVDDELMVSQCLSFFAAGFDTSASTLHFTLFELAKNKEAQKKAIEEVDEYLHRQKNQLTYDCITDLPYLDACVGEALRLYPVLGILTREVVEDYTLPTGVQLGKGMRIHIPVYHLHYHPDHFPEPERYRPERFLPEEKHNIKPYTYLPFGEGPRICIGMRFAKMQMMAALVTILKKYQVELAEGMSPNPELDPRGFTTQTRGGIYLKLSVREGWEQRVYQRGREQ